MTSERLDGGGYNLKKNSRQADRVNCSTVERYRIHMELMFITVEITCHDQVM